MPTTQPRNVRLSKSVIDRLERRAARDPGLKSATLAALMIDEGLRMEEHPGIVFREGPTGRRAVVIGSGDVWEVIRAIRSARIHEPELDEDSIVDLVSTNTGMSQRHVRTAIAYWSSYPAEVESRISQAELVEEEAAAEHIRAHELLS
ncbi:MAG: hypothetical protein HQ526_06765, partial [Actinobacteria bacterium]|nr:hypothetical protein [Actinomycetota bacterium]